MTIQLKQYLKNYVYVPDEYMLISEENKNTELSDYCYADKKISIFTNEFWTSKQRQSNAIHEVSYRACFKAELPRFFINILTKETDIVYDPFAGRGTTIIEAALCNRHIVANDINPLSKILSKPRLIIPALNEIEIRLKDIVIKDNLKADIDLSMFYHEKTESEIVSLRNYLLKKEKLDYLDDWIRMVATNRLTGHSKGFFSVYTLPPNQAVSQSRQIQINEKRNQKPEYRDVKKIILKKTKSLIKDITPKIRHSLKQIAKDAIFLNEDARNTYQIKSNSIALTVTSPPFLDVVQYADDNWLRCWFNNIDVKDVGKNITMSKKLEDWENVMGDVFKELYRITKKTGWVAFEVGEVRGGKIKLEEHVIPLGISAGFECEGVMINDQVFSKTSNCWGVKNNKKGTNTNRIVIFQKRK